MGVESSKEPLPVLLMADVLESNQNLENLQENFQHSVHTLTAQLQDLKQQVGAYKGQCNILREECQLLQKSQASFYRCLEFALKVQSKSKIRAIFSCWVSIAAESRRSAQDQQTMTFVCDKLYSSELAIAFERFCGAAAHLKAQSRTARRAGFWMKKRAVQKILRFWSTAATRERLSTALKHQSSQQFSVRRKEAPFVEELITSLQGFGDQWLMLRLAPDTQKEASSQISKILCAIRVSSVMKRTLVGFWFRLYLLGVKKSRTEHVRIAQFTSRRKTKQLLNAFRKYFCRTCENRERVRKLGRAILLFRDGVLRQHLNAWFYVLVERKGSEEGALQNSGIESDTAPDRNRSPASHTINDSQKRIIAMLLAASLRKMQDRASNAHHAKDSSPAECSPGGNTSEERNAEESGSPNRSFDSADSNGRRLQGLKLSLQHATRSLDNISGFWFSDVWTNQEVASSPSVALSL